MSRSASKSKVQYLFLGIIILVALWIRLINYRFGLWGDEITAIAVAEKPIKNIFLSLDFAQHAPPLDYIILHFISLISHADFAYRLPALIWGMVSIALLFFAVRHYNPS